MKTNFIIINTLLITLLSYIFVDMIYNIADAKFDTFIESANISGASTRSEQSAFLPKSKKTLHPFSYYKSIIKRDLFKTDGPSEKKEKKIVDESLELTELDLKLWGTVTGNTRKPFAVIEETKGPKSRNTQMLYSTGDQVQGATIVQILDEKIILKFEGENEILELEEFKSDSRRRPYNRYSRNRSTRPPVRSKRTIKRTEIENAMGDLNTLMKQVRFYPHAEGIKVSRINRNSIFRRFGLRNGDIITGIDGRKISSIDDAMGFYNQLNSSSSLSVELKRRGRNQVIDFEIN
ncbi:MAG: PDZ domain-containing protein [Proteobacteria bacterium]|nr:PDZ domain-containing protein [Pseudomonadota bacterium]